MGVDVDVLLVSPTYSGAGGVARHVSGLAACLVRLGYRVGVISSDNTFILNFKGLKNPSFMLTSSLKAWRYKARVVHANSIPSAPAMRLTPAGRRVLTLHGVYAEQVKILHGTLLGRAAAYFEKKFMGWADAVTAVSSHAAETYRRKGWEVIHIPNAIDVVEREKIRGVRLGWRQVVYVGRLSREKNVGSLIAAAEKIPDAVFVVVGDGPEAGRLRQLAKGLPNVKFVGHVEHSKALEYIAGSDVFALPSIAEGLSTALLEAMSLKTPVVATSVGGNIELVENGVTGLLVEPGDDESFAEAVRKLLDDRETAEKLSENAYKTVKAKYSWDAVLPKYLEVYGLG
jgi:glycosyltransferase involved in cell wall biosynthesis